jgi:hypothetical protein
MSEPQGTEVITPVVTEETSSTGHPAWEEVFEGLPDSMRPLLTPHLEKWDKGVEARIAKANEQFAPWKDLADAQINPDAAIQALNFMQAIENDPAGVVKALQDAYGLTKAEAKAVVAEKLAEGETPTEQSPEAKRIAELEARLTEVANGVQSQTKAQQDAKNAGDLRIYLDGLKEKFPLVPETVVVAYLANGLDGEKAAKDYMANLDASMKAAQTPGEAAPTVLGATGGLPTNQQDLTKLTEKERKDLAVRMLEEASKQA